MPTVVTPLFFWGGVDKEERFILRPVADATGGKYGIRASPPRLSGKISLTFPYFLYKRLNFTTFSPPQSHCFGTGAFLKHLFLGVTVTYVTYGWVC